MERRVAKELLHVRDWLAFAGRIVESGEAAYLADPLLQEAGDSVMMKLGEAANRLDRAGYPPPAGMAWADAVANRNWIIHQYDAIDRDITWNTLVRDLPALASKLASAFAEADEVIAAP
ncbi:MAG: DUF86 domain-containing protein [Propionibacteriaceae bacterium]|jgi:uncharacterized protein with HEPN domain|nr:DUF86 domain-containing protein [Propionibacteriaceae bacterium]